jgi:hypothetical protein
MLDCPPAVATTAIIAMYESDITRFVRELLDRNPKLRELQNANRATWWDKPQDLEEQGERAASAVEATGYAYFPLPRAPGAKPEKG